MINQEIKNDIIMNTLSNRNAICQEGEGINANKDIYVSK